MNRKESIQQELIGIFDQLESRLLADIDENPQKHQDTIEKLHSILHGVWGKVPRSILAAYYLGEYHVGIVNHAKAQTSANEAMTIQVAEGFATAIGYVTLASSRKNQLEDMRISSSEDSLRSEVIIGSKIEDPRKVLKGLLSEKLAEELRSTLEFDPSGFSLLDEYIRNFRGSSLNARGARLARSLYRAVYPLTPAAET